MTTAHGPDEVSVVEAAAALGVSDRQVRHLVSRGELFSPRRGRISAVSLRDHVARRGEVQARVWSPRTAWAALELLTGGAAHWLGSSQRARLRRELIELDAERVVSKLRNRAEVRGYRVAEARVPAVEADVAVVRPKESGLDGYVEERVLYRLVSSEQMVKAVPGDVTLRVLPPEVGQDFAEMVISQGQVVAGVDLMTSHDAVERRMGHRVVTEALYWVR
jgi:hypothetical protein